MTDKKLSQKDRVYEFIINNGMSANTNELRAFGTREYIADSEKRCRELFAQGKLQRRNITQEEMARQGLKTKVKVYYIPDKQLQLSYPEQRKRVIL